MITRHLFIRMYPRMGEILHLMGSSSLMALPAEADLSGPLASEIERYLETDTASAGERVRLFRLAWDASCSAFGSRQILYERFFQRDSYRNVALLNSVYDKGPATRSCGSSWTARGKGLRRPVSTGAGAGRPKIEGCRIVGPHVRDRYVRRR